MYNLDFSVAVAGLLAHLPMQGECSPSRDSGPSSYKVKFPQQILACSFSHTSRVAQRSVLARFVESCGRSEFRHIHSVHFKSPYH
jgi:hypothetical protein